jgi:hypothetical protein
MVSEGPENACFDIHVSTQNQLANGFIRYIPSAKIEALADLYMNKALAVKNLEDNASAILRK